MSDTLGVYVHWPFCVSKCLYCGFVSHPIGTCDKNTHLGQHGSQLVNQDLYLQALVKEISTRAASFSDLLVDTIYLGGGTPTIAGPERIETVLKAVRAAFKIAASQEITIEANPDSLSKADMQSYKESGINRISLGVQSLSDVELKKLGRAHTAAQARAAVETIVSAEISSTSADLIYGMRGQTITDLTSNIKELAKQGISHISIYGLSLDEGSSLYRDKRDDLLLSDDRMAEMYEAAVELLVELGFDHYEISNFSLPGKRSRHNDRYWQRQRYIGFGLNAASFFGGARTRNTPDLSRYLETAGVSGMPHLSLTEPVTDKAAFEEEVYLGLRRREGIPASIFDHPLYGDVLRTELNKSEYGGYVNISDNISLTTTGFLLSNEIFSRIMNSLDQSAEGSRKLNAR